MDGGIERPRAVSEYLVERMVKGGADKICFVISPGKFDILEYFGGTVQSAHVCYTVQPQATGLCDAIFRALPLISPNEPVIVGLPDTIWFPADALRSLSDDRFSLLLFPVEQPELFDAVITDKKGQVLEIRVKRPERVSPWVWGAFKMPGSVLTELYDLWIARQRKDEYVGTLVNAWLRAGGKAVGVRAGEAYVDVGTLHGYREAIRLLEPRGERQNKLAFGLGAGADL
jgi:dTDP-glucose pyrophosphorylase